MALSMHVDPFAVEDPSELPDWRLPLSFMKSRHTEKIKGDELGEDSWRMKDRVRRVEGGTRTSCISTLWAWLLWRSLSYLPDEDLECSPGLMPEHRC